MVLKSLTLAVYEAPDGSCPFQEWFDALDPGSASRLTKSLMQMAFGNLGDTKAVGSGVLERRIDFGPGYRIYFGRDGDAVIILLAGGTKRRQQRDIDVARARWQDYKTRRKEAADGTDA